jgi:mRNA-degrading endonuclease YafQ of YafQ-DinJ toxin-antitoxin module
MRIDELIRGPRQVVATTRFNADLRQVLKTNPKAKKDLEKFIEFRKIHGPERHFAKKDYMLSNGDLAGFWHWHLVFGRLILFYQMTADQLQLIAITSHKMVDGIPPRSFTNWLQSLAPGSFEPFRMPDDGPEPELTEDEKKSIIQLFWELASDRSDREYLIAASRGDWDEDIKDYILQMVDQPVSDDGKWALVITGFGGEDALQQEIRKILGAIRSA